ncbi:MCP four helix bundle domain-containing protein [Roseivirga pacifica]|uniref:MCP four helix bundle domain-containing protein n=1 Tax=Roseivirga pacifica TaxID=1267423 RepID=UPI002094C9A1|nr:MCP four helix bundle domain-containing protein [Roseivirga pacifica]MCO6360750.1 chemotaxis protein [Roseivirga pacifica]MCO6368639.1 chemotaxis protein [Roseivirga pacifica]MCO6372782.1 chemotaxis protein [Roseivirga pacifica]MCO6376840.1 chemotaxis protein [Roseivirga pacifica]MCO6377881.1 chemotaxis protein [Roseivirga pacifica]
MDFYTKLKWILGISLVFALIAATNLVDRSNFMQVKESVATIYEDRLIVKDLIMDMYKAMQQKKIAIISDDSSFMGQRNDVVNNDLKALIERYQATKLTKNEATVFENLKSNIDALWQAEASVTTESFKANEHLLGILAQVESNLDELSEIQISEGRRQVSITKRATDSIELFTQLEIYVLIFLALVIQVIILYKPRKG